MYAVDCLPICLHTYHPCRHPSVHPCIHPVLLAVWPTGRRYCLKTELPKEYCWFFWAPHKSHGCEGPFEEGPPQKKGMTTIGKSGPKKGTIGPSTDPAESLATLSEACLSLRPPEKGRRSPWPFESEVWREPRGHLAARGHDHLLTAPGAEDQNTRNARPFSRVSRFDSFSILFNHRSFQQPIAIFSLAFWRFSRKNDQLPCFI